MRQVLKSNGLLTRKVDDITSELNRSDGRVQPAQLPAALIWTASVCFPDAPGHVVAKVNRFGFVGRSFMRSVHTFALEVKFLRNHEALLSAKLNQVRLDGDLHNPARFAFTADVVNGCDEFTKRPGYLRGIVFHA